MKAVFDSSYYRAAHSDLAGLSDEALRFHYDTHGRSEGRVANALALRENFLGIVPKDRPVLEIGPFGSPSVRGDKVDYFDVLDRDALIERATRHQTSTDCPIIRFVSPTGDLSVVDEMYDAVISSHCIEHQLDVIGHLKGVERVLRPGGCYYLLIPDRRYCFDHFIHDSTIADVIDAHVRPKGNHSPKSIIEHRVLTTHNDESRHWRGDHGLPQLNSVTLVLALDEISRLQGAYVDVHAWQFTPETFRDIMTHLKAVDLIGLSPTCVFDTPWGRNEFCAVLTLES